VFDRVTLGDDTVVLVGFVYQLHGKTHFVRSRILRGIAPRRVKWPLSVSPEREDPAESECLRGTLIKLPFVLSLSKEACRRTGGNSGTVAENGRSCFDRLSTNGLFRASLATKSPPQWAGFV
jgi:hypothetical protein